MVGSRYPSSFLSSVSRIITQEWLLLLNVVRCAQGL